MFNFNTQPYGATTPEADAAKALAVRQAVGRTSSTARRSRTRSTRAPTRRCTRTFPRASPAPPRRSRASTATATADRTPTKAKATLEAAGVTTPVALSLQYSPDHYGPSSGDEYALVKSQLEESGLFTVDLKSTEWVQYSKDRTSPTCTRVPARLVPGLLRRRQLPDAVLPRRRTSSATTSATRGRGAHPRRRPSRPTRPRARRSEDIQERRRRSSRPCRCCRARRSPSRAPTSTGVVLDASFKFRFAPLTK